MRDKIVNIILFGTTSILLFDNYNLHTENKILKEKIKRYDKFFY